MPGGFICIASDKSLELGGDGALHRADHLSDLHSELEFRSAAIRSDAYAFLPGGGVRAINPSPSMTLAETPTAIAVFKGSLSNGAKLAAALGLHADATNAELLTALYAKLGVDMLGHLEGAFAFCLYDSRQARVLAARDPGGKVPLMHGVTARGSLLIACGTYLPPGALQVEEIRPGEFKYGWHAAPRTYVPGVLKQPDTRRSSMDGASRRRTPTGQRLSLDMSRSLGSESPFPPSPALRPGSRRSSGTGDRPPPLSSPRVAAAAAHEAAARACSSQEGSEDAHSSAASEEAAAARRRPARRSGRQRASEDGSGARPFAGAASPPARAPPRQVATSAPAGRRARPSGPAPAPHQPQRQQRGFALDAAAPEFKPRSAAAAPGAGAAAASAVVQRNGSCSELTAQVAGSGAKVLLPAMQGLAC